MVNKVDKLNILRFLAFMMIFLLHATAYMPDGWDQMPHSWLIYTPAWAGTWIFFVLAGYGVGASLCSGKFDPLISRELPIHKSGLVRFYIRRLTVIIPMYWLWILIVACFVQSDILRPGPTHIKMLLRLFLLNYHEEFSQDTFGVAWYITTLMSLYLIAPLIYYLMRRFVKTRKRLLTAIAVIIVFFLGLRLAMLQYYRINMPDLWSVQVYKPFLFNIDLFSCGMLINLDGKLPDNDRKPMGEATGYIGIISACSIVGLSLIAGYHYYLADRVLRATTVFMDIYRYILPSVYLILCLIYVYCFDICNKNYTQTALTTGQVVRNPLRLFDCFRLIQYPMYLFHPVVMYCLKEIYMPGMYEGSLGLLGVSPDTFIWAQGILFIVYAFGLTTILSTAIVSIGKTR